LPGQARAGPERELGTLEIEHDRLTYPGRAPGDPDGNAVISQQRVADESGSRITGLSENGNSSRPVLATAEDGDEP
jgi:hypothetical protein